MAKIERVMVVTLTEETRQMSRGLTSEKIRESVQADMKLLRGIKW